jgi:hypothetical protein
VQMVKECFTQAHGWRFSLRIYSHYSACSFLLFCKVVSGRQRLGSFQVLLWRLDLTFYEINKTSIFEKRWSPLELI